MSAVLQKPFDTTQECIRQLSSAYKPSAVDLINDLSVWEVNSVKGYLGIVGSIGHIEPLHHNLVLLRQIVASELPKLHLVWFERIIYIKPLPDCLLNAAFVEDVVCPNNDLYALVAGFLNSYCALIRSPVDLTIAQERHLISKELTWDAWYAYRKALLDNATIQSNISKNPRYRYGELRLPRLNLIWRCTGRGLTYFTQHRTYDTYFKEYLIIYIAIFAFVASILTALQTALTANPRAPHLVKVSYHFSIAVLYAAALCVLYVGVVFMAMVLYNHIVAFFDHRMRKLPKAKQERIKIRPDETSKA